MSLPTFTCEIAFDDNALTAAPATWYNQAGAGAANYVESFTIARGRQTEDDQAQTGQYAVQLMDDARRFDNSYAAGPFFGKLLPRKQVRTVATLDAVAYPVFKGFVDPIDGWVRQEGDWPASVPTALLANDAFELLANAQTASIFGGVGAPTGTQIAAVLALMGWPVGWESLDAGRQTVVTNGTGYPVGTKLLAILRDIEVSEPGFIFADHSGNVAFRDRDSRPNQRTSAATFCDTKNEAGGRILYDSVTTRRSKLYNDVLAAIVSAGVAQTTQEAQDAASRGVYGPLTNTYNGLWVSASDALDYARFQLALHSSTFEVVDSLTLVPGTDSPTWLQVLQRELNDRITLVRTPPGQNVSVTQDYFIEAINIAYGPGPDARCTWRLTPAGVSGTPGPGTEWLSGIAGYSEAATTTIAGY